MQATNDTSSKIKPIQTEYKGYKFRSRLEARWAVFFDNVGIHWDYESEGYDLGVDGYYLPDFFITSPQGYKGIYEVKPYGYVPDGKLKKLLTLLREENGCEYGKASYEHILPFGEVLVGDPINVFFETFSKTPIICPRCGLIQYEPYAGSLWSNDYINVGCEACDFQEGNGRYPKEDKDYPTLFSHTYCKGLIEVTDGDYHDYCVTIWVAAERARQARFEHGEHP